MPLLAYCIAKEAAKIPDPSLGLQDKRIQRIAESGLAAFASEYQQRDEMNDAKASALAFNHVLQELLQQITIIPFRFPTIVNSEGEILDFLRQHADEYHKTLDRLKDSVQMEINLRLEHARPESIAAESGTEYLTKRQMQRHRLLEMASLFKESSATCTRDWRQREGGESVRCFALVARDNTVDFVRRMKTIQLPSDMHARITGPWPATEFVKEKQKE